MKNTLKGNDKGAALVAVIMAMLVLSIMSLAVLSATTSNVKNGLEEREYQSSYYIAEGGVTYHAQEVKSEILDIYNDPDIDTADDFFDAIDANLADPSISKTLDVSTGHFEEQYGGAPDAEVRVIKDTGPSPDPNVRKYIIESTGTVDGIPRKVLKPITFKWIDKSVDPWEPEYAVFTYGPLTVTDGDVYGPIFSQGKMTINWGLTINGDAYSMGDLVNSGRITGKAYSKGNLHNDWSVTIEGNVYAEGDVINNGIIVGDVYANGNVTGGGTINGTVYSGSAVDLPEFPPLPEEGTELPLTDPFRKFKGFPAFPTESQYVERESINTNVEMPYTLDLGSSAVTYIPTINITNSRVLTIKYTNNDILMVDNFNIETGDVYLDGTGTLKLYIKNNMNFNNGELNKCDSNVEEDILDVAEKLMIYSRGSIIELKGGASVILAKGVYAPNATVKAVSDGKIDAPVIAHKYEMTGSNSFIRYYPPIPGAPTPPPPIPTDPNELVHSEEPIREY